MRPHERLLLARLVYRQAVVRAQQQPTAASWSRLLAAARNTRTASQDMERHQPRAQPRSTRDPAPVPEPQDPRPEAAAAAPSLSDPSAVAWCDHVQECLRARALIEQSRQLVRQARALRSSVSEFALVRPRVIISLRHDLA